MAMILKILKANLCHILDPKVVPNAIPGFSMYSKTNQFPKIETVSPGINWVLIYNLISWSITRITNKTTEAIINFFFTKTTCFERS
jgi:hypothetical protein